MGQMSDADKIESLYSLYEQEMFRVCLAVLGDVHSAEDAVSESFLKLIRHRDRIGDPASVSCRHFVIKTTRNTAIDMYRKCTRERKYREEFPQMETLGTSTVLDVTLSETEMDVLDKLDDKYRLVVKLIAIEGLSVHECAAVLRISEACVRKRLERARRRVEQLLSVKE